MGIDEIPYDEDAIMRTLAGEAQKKLGPEEWERIMRGLTLPDPRMPLAEASHATRSLMERFHRAADPEQIKQVLTAVRHGLTHDEFAWAREKFLQYGNIDAFAAAMQEDIIRDMEDCLSRGESFYGQPVDRDVMDFVRGDPNIFYGRRAGSAIYATAIPYQTQGYLREKDVRKKRHLACHCHFARESILQEEGPVSPLFCYCSLGHTKVFWEAALDTPLAGDVVESALGGGLRCRFVIRLPEEVIEQYT